MLLSTSHLSTPQGQQTKSLPGEIISHVGSFLGPQHLYVCIQLSQRWNDCLIPQLWKHMYCPGYIWPKVLKQNPTTTGTITSTEAEVSTEADDTRLRDMFVKYGHHIRTLYISSPVAIAAIYSAGTCTRLQSLTISSIQYRCGAWYLPVWARQNPDQQQQVVAPLEAPPDPWSRLFLRATSFQNRTQHRAHVRKTHWITGTWSSISGCWSDRTRGCDN